MKISRFWLITFLSLSLLVLVAVVALGNWYAPALGDAGLRLQHFLFHPLFNVGELPITFFFVLKAAIFLVVLILASHFTLLLLQKRVLTYLPLEIGQQYAVARVVSYLVFVLGLIVGLQSLGLNLSSLVVLGGALGIGVGLGLQAIVSNFVAGLILLLEQPIKLGDRIDVGNTSGDVVRLRGRSTWIRTNENVVIIVPNSEFINQRVTNWTANDRQVRISLPWGFHTIAIQRLCEKSSSRWRGAILMFSRNPAPRSFSSNLEIARSTSSFECGLFGKCRPLPS